MRGDLPERTLSLSLVLAGPSRSRVFWRCVLHRSSPVQLPPVWLSLLSDPIRTRLDDSGWPPGTLYVDAELFSALAVFARSRSRFQERGDLNDLISVDSVQGWRTAPRAEAIIRARNSNFEIIATRYRPAGVCTGSAADVLSLDDWLFQEPTLRSLAKHRNPPCCFPTRRESNPKLTTPQTRNPGADPEADPPRRRRVRQIVAPRPPHRRPLPPALGTESVPFSPLKRIRGGG